MGFVKNIQNEWTEEPSHDLGEEHSNSREKQIKMPQCWCEHSMTEENQSSEERGWRRQNKSNSSGKWDGEVARDPSI